MSVTTETGDTPILDTRIPEGRTVPGLDYGAVVLYRGIPQANPARAAREALAS